MRSTACTNGGGETVKALHQSEPPWLTTVHGTCMPLDATRAEPELNEPTFATPLTPCSMVEGV